MQIPICQIKNTAILPPRLPEGAGEKRGRKLLYGELHLHCGVGFRAPVALEENFQGQSGGFQAVGVFAGVAEGPVFAGAFDLKGRIALEADVVDDLARVLGLQAEVQVRLGVQLVKGGRVRNGKFVGAVGTFDRRRHTGHQGIVSAGHRGIVSAVPAVDQDPVFAAGIQLLSNA